MIDLHLHTLNSDGRDTPVQILEKAEKLGLDAISITDHDTVDSYLQLKDVDVATIYGGKLIPGVEITAVLDGTCVHILGYNIDADIMNAKMRKISQSDMLAFVCKRFEEVLSKYGVIHKCNYGSIRDLVVNTLELGVLDKLPFNVDIAPGENNAPSGSVLFFRHILNKNSKLHVDLTGFLVEALDAIELIRECGGIAVLAHPAQCYDQKEEIIETLIGKIDGIECYHWSATPAYRDYLIELCKENNLIVTGGSDHHGEDTMGSQNVPNDLLCAIIGDVKSNNCKST